MAKSIYTIAFGTILIFLIGCGGDNSSVDNSQNKPITTLEDTYASWTVAKNNSVQDTSKAVGSSTMRVLIEPSKQIDEDAVSNTVSFVFGKVNGTKTGIGINQNYINGTKMVVCIYDANGDILATSEVLIYAGANNNIKFNDINF